MDILSIIFLAIGLAMDCFAVSIAQGMQRTPLRSVIPMAILFGLFQGGMPLIAYYAGGVFADFFTRWSHWIALVLLVLIGGKMLIEAIVESRRHPTAQACGDPVQSKVESPNAEQLVVTLRDNGGMFDPTKQAEVDTDVVTAERQIGGLGIALVRQIADELYYRRVDGVNELIIIKNI